VLSGRPAITLFKAWCISLAVPSKKHPQPATNRVSPVNSEPACTIVNENKLNVKIRFQEDKNYGPRLHLALQGTERVQRCDRV
jgi:hypothetical protein